MAASRGMAPEETCLPGFGAPRVLVRSAPVASLVVDGASVYYVTSDDTLWRVGRGGGERTVVARGFGGLNKITVGADAVYGFRRTHLPVDVRRVAKDGGDLRTIFRAEKSISALAAEGPTVWIGDVDGALVCLDENGAIAASIRLPQPGVLDPSAAAARIEADDQGLILLKWAEKLRIVAHDRSS